MRPRGRGDGVSQSLRRAERRPPPQVSSHGRDFQGAGVSRRRRPRHVRTVRNIKRLPATSAEAAGSLCTFGKCALIVPCEAGRVDAADVDTQRRLIDETPSHGLPSPPSTCRRRPTAARGRLSRREYRRPRQRSLDRLPAHCPHWRVYLVPYLRNTIARDIV